MKSNEYVYSISWEREPSMIQADETEIRNGDRGVNGFSRVEDLLNGTTGEVDEVTEGSMRIEGRQRGGIGSHSVERRRSGIEGWDCWVVDESG